MFAKRICFLFHQFMFHLHKIEKKRRKKEKKKKRKRKRKKKQHLKSRIYKKPNLMFAKRICFLFHQFVDCCGYRSEQIGKHAQIHSISGKCNLLPVIGLIPDEKKL